MGEARGGVVWEWRFVSDVEVTHAQFVEEARAAGGH